MSATFDEGRPLHATHSDGAGKTSDHGPNHSDTAPGDQPKEGTGVVAGIRGYLFGLGLASLLTVMSFSAANTGLIWAPGIPVALIVFAIAQMGVHLVFFLHITTAPDSTNNAMALAFGVLIVILLIGGSLFVMTHLNNNMLSMDQIMQMQR